MRQKENCRSSAGTIQIRRSRPSGLALALALLLTIIFVYAIANAALPQHSIDAASAEAPMSTQLRMEGLKINFRVHSRCAEPLQARIHAAQCISEGGAGMILADGSGYAIICETMEEPGKDSLKRDANGLTLKLQGSARELAAIADAVAFLRAQATETGSLAAALENGETDAASICALLGVYRTQGERIADALDSLPGHAAVSALLHAINNCLSRLSDSAATPSGLRLLHAAACGEWIGLLEDLAR